MRDTIFALATAPGRSAVAIVRVSGPLSSTLLPQLCSRTPKPRHAALRTVSGSAGEIIDQAVVLWFPGPDSFTGEDVFELQLHGGPSIVEAVFVALEALGARPAEPGEFTRRAFEGGRLDLSQAEAVADLIDAETEAQRRQALAQLGGALTKRSEAWRETLLSTLAFLEAQIDFPDEEIPDGGDAEIWRPLADLAEEMRRSLSKSTGERIREGLKIALIGAPNAGKSSLLNALVGESAAIVTSAPGTTRDIIERSYVIEGYKLLLADTAGIRDTTDEIEAEGVRRALVWASSADLRLWLVDCSVAQPIPSSLPTFVRAGDILTLTKSDLRCADKDSWAKFAAGNRLVLCESSTQNAGGIVQLCALLRNHTVSALTGSEFPASTQIRHRLLITDALSHLHRALERSSHDYELAAEDVRLTYRALERLSGKLSPEDVLDRVFSTFCIGK